MNSMKKFIITQDEKTAEKLKNLGFNLFSKNNNTFIFENVSDKKSSIEDIGKIVFTNRVFL